MKPTICRTSSLPSPRNFGTLLLAVLLVLGAVTAPASACLHSTWESSSADPEATPADLWIEMNGENVTLKFRGFTTFAPSEGGGRATCGCGLANISAFASMSPPMLVRADNGQRIAAFNFKENDQTAMSLGGTGSWSGFSTGNRVIPDNIKANLVFTVKVKPGTTFNDLRTQLRGAQNVLGFGQANPSTGGISNPSFCSPTVIDQTPSPQAAPVIKVGKTTMGHPSSIELTVQDAEEGLATLRSVDATHATEALPNFVAGTKNPVRVEYTMAEDLSEGSIGLEACNLRKECATLRADVIDLKVGLGGLASRSFQEVPSAKSLIRIQNGDPGATMFILTANGQRFSVRPLASDQFLDLNVPLAMSEEKNAVTLALRGAPGGEAMLMMIQLPAGAPKDDTP